MTIMTTKMKAMTTKKKKEEEEEEESDEDEISDIGKSTPLKLNTQNESVPPQQSNYNPVNITDLGSNTTNNITDKQGYENTEGFGTPSPIKYPNIL